MYVSLCLQVRKDRDEKGRQLEAVTNQLRAIQLHQTSDSEVRGCLSRRTSEASLKCTSRSARAHTHTHTHTQLHAQTSGASTLKSADPSLTNSAQSAVQELLRRLKTKVLHACALLLPFQLSTAPLNLPLAISGRWLRSCGCQPAV